ncbi:RidA family protein [Paenibacillus mesotrionivorans]|uniref:RidA family protein n=1 Tax=Paenibacillus mesotrionivorans TaxID=3160968 RepID=A0ACC7NTT6_9BACL
MILLQELTVKEYQAETHIRYYITLDLNQVHSLEETIHLYRYLYDYIEELQLQIVYEKVFGRLAVKESLLHARAAWSRGAEVAPVSYIDGMPITDSPLSSITVYGVKQHKSQIHIKYIKDIEGDSTGTFLSFGDVNYLYLINISESALLSDRYSEFRRMFEVCHSYMEQYRFSSSDIVRTWIYLDDIKQDYIVLNEARRDFFDKARIDYSAYSDQLPASTCIEGRSSQRHNSVIDLVCIDKSAASISVKRVFNQNQNEAEGNSYLYKPTFARAISICSHDWTELQISGTASINEAGKTVFVNDPYNQIKKTMLNVLAILNQFNMSFENIALSTCFFKKPHHYSYYQAVLKELCLGEFPASLVKGHVCRDDLLFEFDAVAFRINERTNPKYEGTH